MKKISAVIPCYNEEENVGPMVETLAGLFRHELVAYDYELILIDNDSQDGTREYLRAPCAENHKIKAIFNAKNFGQFNSPYYGMLQSTSDATVPMVADFQDPPEMIVKYAAAWEEGYKITIGIRAHSVENPPMYHPRSPYYKQIRKLSKVDQTEHFAGFGLYDKSFIQVLRNLNDPMSFLCSIAVELGHRRKEISYDQSKRRAGKMSDNLYRLYDAAMLSATSYTKFGLRLATFLGGTTLAVSVVIVLVYLAMKPLYWDHFQVGLAPLLIGMLFLGAVQIFFIGMVGEYMLTINQRVMKRPLVAEAERLNFESEDAEEMQRSTESTWCAFGKTISS